ncbi:MAG: hydroxyisourate hydrolase, partial [Cyanobacteria bacterium]|nr:hydroxyisourate hydrolase [Cyanobacteriota bacterium]
MAGITTHVLDTAQGRPAAGVAVALEFREGDEWRPIASGTTNQDGRITDLTTGKTLEAGIY